MGFEPTDEFPRQRFSRPPDSTALAPRRALSVFTDVAVAVVRQRSLWLPLGLGRMDSSASAEQLDVSEVSPSPFRTAFDRARSEALQGPGGPLAADPRPVPAQLQFEYRLEKRQGKRSADEADWNELGRKGWELVGVTGKHAAFKRRVASDVSR